MKIVVCIKQVPDTAEIKINRDTGTLIREGVPSIINPFDMYALEEGLRLKEKHGGTVTVISMGPPQVSEALREALSLGVDEAILLSDRAFAGADSLATSYTLAQGIKKIGGADVILCGKQAIDGDTAQVGPGIAEHLDIPHITYVKKVEINDKQVRAERLVEGGYEVIESSLPILLTVVKEINEPRMPALRASLRAKHADIPVMTATDLPVEESRIGLKGSPTQVKKIFTPELHQEGEIFRGSPAQQAEALVSRLREAKII